MIQSEGVDYTQALDLALKIMEYERNLAYERSVFEQFAAQELAHAKRPVEPMKGSPRAGGLSRPDAGPFGAVAAVPQFKALGSPHLDNLAGEINAELEEMMDDELLFGQSRDGKTSKTQLLEIEKLAASATLLLRKVEAHKRRQENLGAQRYLRRSLNQLIKALKGLTAT